jgi:hypothetical protein
MIRMKRVLAAFIALAMAISAVPLLAIDTRSRVTRIALLDLSPRANVSSDAFRTVRETLCNDLRSRGFDAFVVEETYESLRRDSHIADYYIEIAGVRRWGGGDNLNVSIGGDLGGVGISDVSGTAAAQLWLLDGRSFDVITSYELESRSSGLAPSTIGAGRGGFFASIFILPIFEQAHVRKAARTVARHAAERIANEIARR